MSSIDRYSPCPCGSGKKYKFCCAAKEAEARRTGKVPTLPEGEFIAELKPELDDEIDRLMQRLQRGDFQGVKERLWSLYRENPGYHMTNFAFGTYIAMIEKDPAQSVPFLTRAVSIFPPLAEGHYNLGSALAATGRIGAAVAAFRKAIRYSGRDPEIAKLAQGGINDLERIILKTLPFATIDAYIKNEELFELAFEHMKEKRYREAAEMFGKVLKENPNHVQSHGNLGLCLAGLGQKAAALASLDRALELDPTYEPARNNKIAIGEMTEGRTLVPGHFAETEYYRERLEAQKAQGREKV